MKFEWSLDPEIVSLFGILPIRYYSILFMLGLVIGVTIVKKYWILQKLPLAQFEKLTIYVFFATIIGARLGHCLFYEPSYFLNNPLDIFLPFNFSDGRFSFTGYRGLASHGGILAVLLTVFLYSKRSKINFFSIADKVVIGGAITAVFIRLGNFMNSEIIGKATNANYGVVFKRVDDTLRHPSQLYEAFAYLVIFGIILYTYQTKRNKQHGFVLGLFFTLLFLARFFIEFSKNNQVPFEDGMLLNMGQLLSIPFILLGLTLMALKARGVLTRE